MIPSENRARHHYDISKNRYQVYHIHRGFERPQHRYFPVHIETFENDIQHQPNHYRTHSSVSVHNNNVGVNVQRRFKPPNTSIYKQSRGHPPPPHNSGTRYPLTLPPPRGPPAAASSDARPAPATPPAKDAPINPSKTREHSVDGRKEASKTFLTFTKPFGRTCDMD